MTAQAPGTFVSSPVSIATLLALSFFWHPGLFRFCVVVHGTACKLYQLSRLFITPVCIPVLQVSDNKNTKMLCRRATRVRAQSRSRPVPLPPARLAFSSSVPTSRHTPNVWPSVQPTIRASAALSLCVPLRGPNPPSPTSVCSHSLLFLFFWVGGLWVRCISV